MSDLLFAFFRFLLIPVKPLLAASAPAFLAPLLLFLVPVLNIANFLATPLIVYLALRGSRFNNYICLDPVSRNILLLKPFLAESSNRASCIEIGGVMYFIMRTCPSSALKNLIVVRPEGKKSILDYQLVFNVVEPREKEFLSKGNYWEKKLKKQTTPAFSIRWGDILEAEDREKLLEFLEKNSGGKLDRNLLEPFRLEPERASYTELWLKEFSGAPKRDKLTPLSAGAKLGDDKYTIVRKVGMGGQATIYLARSLKDPQEEFVVLKEFMLPVYPDIRVRKKAAERFQNEAAMLGRLKHPQIARFFDLFLEDHRAYLVIEHIEGQSLKDLVLAEGAQPEESVLEIARQVAGIIKYLHEQDPPVLHRDLTPDNMMLENGQVKLIDFSVAQEHSSGITGSVVGKPNYISPEQFRGKPTKQSDIYSLGATLYYLSTGSDPPPITVLHPTKVNDSLSTAFDALVAKATQLDPQLRFQNIDEFQQELSLVQERLTPGKLTKGQEDLVDLL